MTTHWTDGRDAKSASISFAFAALRYALGGEDKTVSIRDCITWLELMEAQRNDRATEV
jgi:hypothetical protein